MFSQKVFEIFSFVDERNLIPLKRFTLSSLGIDIKLTNQTNISYDFLFITNSVRTIMLDIMTQLVVYIFELHPIPYEVYQLSQLFINYNGREVFVSRTLDIGEINSSAKMMTTKSKEREERFYRRREEEEEEELEEADTTQVTEVIETHLDIIIAPLPSVTLYSLCRQLVLKLCPVENDLIRLPIPNRVKADLVQIRKYYKGFS